MPVASNRSRPTPPSYGTPGPPHGCSPLSIQRAAAIRAASRAARRARCVRPELRRAARAARRRGRHGELGAACGAVAARRRGRLAAAHGDAAGGGTDRDERCGNGTRRHGACRARAWPAPRLRRRATTARPCARPATSRGCSRLASRICRSRSFTSRCWTRSTGSSATSRSRAAFSPRRSCIRARSFARRSPSGRRRSSSCTTIRAATRRPVADDRIVTEQLVAAGKLLDIPVHDHIIIGRGRYTSFAEAGLL